MSKKEKLMKKFLSFPIDFTYEEMTALLNALGFDEYQKGKTSGSKVVFYNSSCNVKILFHKPHPSNCLKKPALKSIYEQLVKGGILT